MKKRTDAEKDEFAQSLVSASEMLNMDEKKKTLAKEILVIEKNLEGLNNDVKNHEGSKKKHVELKESIVTLEATKGFLEHEISLLEMTINDKQSVKSEVERLRGMVKVLQQEMKDFSSNHEKIKNDAGQVIVSLKQKLLSMKSDVDNVLGQFE